jgi:hypothetical protein
MCIVNINNNIPIFLINRRKNMAYMTIQINTGSVGPSIGDLNKLLLGGGTNSPDTGAATEPDEVIQNIINLMYGIKGGNYSAELSVNSSTNAGTPFATQTGGTANFTISFK